MKKAVLLVLAGGLGALSRYLVAGWVQEKLGSSFPWGTMTVNVLGCLIFGLLWTMAQERFLISTPISFIVLTGFVNSFTTFSTMTFEALQLIRSTAWTTALIYLGTGQILGLLAAFMGIQVGRLI